MLILGTAYWHGWHLHLRLSLVATCDTHNLSGSCCRLAVQEVEASRAQATVQQLHELVAGKVGV
jgi:hypothetical protein